MAKYISLKLAKYALLFCLFGLSMAGLPSLAFASNQSIINVTLAKIAQTTTGLTYFDGSWTGGVVPYTISFYSGPALSNPYSASAANCSSYPLFVSSNLYTSQSFNDWIVNTASANRSYICYMIVDAAGHSAYSPVLRISASSSTNTTSTILIPTNVSTVSTTASTSTTTISSAQLIDVITNFTVYYFNESNGKTVIKTFGGTTVQAGSAFIYKLNFTNNGNLPIYWD